METVDLEMDDLFGGGEEERNELQMPAELPEMDDNEGPMNNDNDDDENEDEENVLASIKNLAKGAAKRHVKRPQPKLDAERLRSARGLPALPKLFKDVKFKGKGHEASDLKLMMGKLEHWAHRLFPRMQFDDFIQRLEKLGGKREVQTCLKRIRMDMPILDEDFVGQDPDGKSDGETDQVDPEAAFEEMLEKEKELSRRQQICDDEDEFDYFDGAPTTPANQSSTPRPSSQDTPTSSLATPTSSLATPTSSQATPSSASTANGTTVNSTPMSEDMKKRMEANRLAAMKKRAARLGIPVEALMNSPAKNPPSATSTPETQPEPETVTMETEDS